jgi:hypothetical protein
MIWDEIYAFKQFITETGVCVPRKYIPMIIAKSIAVKAANRGKRQLTYGQRNIFNRNGPRNQALYDFVEMGNDSLKQVSYTIDANNLSNKEYEELQRLLKKAHYYNSLIKNKSQ